MKIKNKKIGTWMQIPSCEIAEILSNFNFDWICLDLEHGSININDIQPIFRVFEKKKIFSFVRIKNATEYNCSKVIEYGAKGIIFSKIEKIEDLQKIKNFCFYPPTGQRGVGFSRHNNYGLKLKEEIKKNKTVIFGMIETKKGLENIDQLLDFNFLDGIFIGPYDLSMSLGIPAQFNNKIFKKNISRIISKCKSKKVLCGIHEVIPDRSQINKRINQGFDFLAIGIDVTFIINSLKKLKLY